MMSTPNELVRLREFKTELRTQGLYHEYKSLAEFETELYRHLDMKVREFIEGKYPAPAQEVANDLAFPLHRDQRLSQPIDFGSTLTDISHGFTTRLDGFARLDGVGPDKFFDLGAHVYNSVARCLDRFLTYSAMNVEHPDREVIRHISTKLKALASSSGEYLKKGFPLFWTNGEEIARELAAHVDYLNAINATRLGRRPSERENCS